MSLSAPASVPFTAAHPEQPFPDWMRGVQTHIEGSLSHRLPNADGKRPPVGDTVTRTQLDGRC